MFFWRDYQKVLGGIHNTQMVKSYSSEASLNPKASTLGVSIRSSPDGLSTQVVAREGGWLYKTKLCSPGGIALLMEQESDPRVQKMS